MSVSHMLKWVQPATLNKYSKGKIMLALRYLQADDCLTKEEPPVPRANRKKKTNRVVGKRTTSHEMMHY